jgi:hypothetical protein
MIKKRKRILKGAVVVLGAILAEAARRLFF